MLDAIGPLPSVNALSLWYCNVIGSAGLRHLHAMPRLTTLGIHVNNYRPYVLDVGDVSEVRTLTTLALGNLDKMTDEQVGQPRPTRAGPQCLFLQEAARVTDRGVAALARLPSLRAL